MNASGTDTPLVARWPVPRGYDMDGTLRFVHAGPRDPTVHQRPGCWIKATRTPHGPASLRLDRGAADVIATSWGPGAPWLQARIPALLGLEDAAPEVPEHDPIARLARACAGLRLVRVPWPFETLWALVLQQRVAFVDAVASHRRLIFELGEPAPGPEPVRLPPEPATLLHTGAHVFRRAGVDARRQGTLLEICRYAPRIAQTADLPLESARRRLSALRGVGPWTLDMTMGFGFGDPDAVPVGDFHLPDLVCWMLAGEPRGSDARMLELLEPYRGFRFRVIRWLYASGRQAPRFGPRLPRR